VRSERGINNDDDDDDNNNGLEDRGSISDWNFSF
jgi:hypothetical protein